MTLHTSFCVVSKVLNQDLLQALEIVGLRLETEDRTADENHKNFTVDSNQQEYIPLYFDNKAAQQVNIRL
jgi:hypothetical protein